MKNVRLCLAATLLTLLAACSNDELISENRSPITYKVTSENVTRADAVYCPNNQMSNFSLYAIHKDGSTYTRYINGETVSCTDGTWGANSTYYWPNSGTVDFYALVNGPSEYTLTSSTAIPPTFSFTPKSTVSEQEDLLYAVATGQSKSDNSSSEVTLNFRHALSQIVFKAKNENDNLKITITGVTVGNVYGSATFTLPTSSTSENIEHVDHSTGDNSSTKINTQGTWNTTTDATKASYSFTLSSSVVLDGASETASELTGIDSYTNAMLLLPQDITSNWEEGEITGPYLGLTCKIEKKSSGNTDYTTLWQEGLIYIPTSFNWVQGKKYTYTFVFSETTVAGYTSEGKKVLVPLKYNVTTDEFVNGTSGNDVSVNDPVVTGTGGDTESGEGSNDNNLELE